MHSLRKNAKNIHFGPKRPKKLCNLFDDINLRACVEFKIYDKKARYYSKRAGLVNLNAIICVIYGYSLLSR